MRVAILSWEFPPRVVGDLGFYVENLASKLGDSDVDVYVVTFSEDRVGIESRVDGVKVYRVANQVKTHLSILTWDLTLSVEFMRAFSDIYYSVGGRVDLIDVHDWLGVEAATALKKAFNIPFLYTIHSLEENRSFYAHEALNTSIEYLERLGSVEADGILVKSDWMKRDVCKLHNISSEKVDVVSPSSPSWIEDVMKIYEGTIETFRTDSRSGK